MKLFYVSYIAVWILVLFIGFLALALLRRLEELRESMKQSGAAGGDFQDDDFLPAGSGSPEFKGVDARSGRRIGIRDLDGGGALLFLSRDCRTCKGLAESLKQHPLNGLAPIIAVCPGGAAAATFFGKRLGEDVLLMSEGAEVAARLYGVSTYPTAVVIGPNRLIREYGHPNNVESLRDLLEMNLNKDPVDIGVTARSAKMRS